MPALLHFVRAWERRLGLAAVLALALVGLRAAPAPAAISTFGSPLSQAAGLNTAYDLSYVGNNVLVPPSPTYPTGVFHAYHFAADMAVWNSALASGQAGAPEGGQVLKLLLEGCAVASPSGPAPLTQIHFQVLSPLSGGGVKVTLTSQPFNLPVCGQGAGPSTVSSYEPVNLCVHQGDYVAFNNEGGFVPYVYPSGVPYEVLGRSAGSTMDSFIRDKGTGDGAALSPSDTTANDGFAVNPNEELLMQEVLGTGPDARYVCPGGSRDKAPTLRPAKINGHTYHVSKTHVVKLGLYCRGPEPCQGEVAIGLPGAPNVFGHTAVNLPGGHTTTVSMRVSPPLLAAIKKHHSVETLVSLTLGATVISQAVTMKVF